MILVKARCVPRRAGKNIEPARLVAVRLRHIPKSEHRGRKRAGRVKLLYVTNFPMWQIRTAA
jgi:hypothetical protein